MRVCYCINISLVKTHIPKWGYVPPRVLYVAIGCLLLPEPGSPGVAYWLVAVLTEPSPHGAKHHRESCLVHLGIVVPTRI